MAAGQAGSVLDDGHLSRMELSSRTVESHHLPSPHDHQTNPTDLKRGLVRVLATLTVMNER